MKGWPFVVTTSTTGFWGALSDQPEDYWRDRRSFTANPDPDIALQQTEIVMAGATILATKEYGPDSFRAPERIELRKGQDGGLNGMFVFCQLLPEGSERLLIEVPCGLLGYEGSGPNMTRQLLVSAGLPKNMVSKIEGHVWHETSYLVVCKLLHTGMVGLSWHWKRLA